MGIPLRDKEEDIDIETIEIIYFSNISCVY